MEQIKKIWNYKPFSKIPARLGIIVCFFFFLIGGACTEQILGGFMGVGIALCLGVLFVMAYRQEPLTAISLGWLVVSVIYGHFFGTRLIRELTVMDQSYTNILEQSVFLRMMLFLSVECLCILLVGELLVFLYRNGQGWKQFIPGVVIANAMIFFLIPLNIMLGNLEEYSFSVFTMMRANIVEMITFSLLEIALFSKLGKRHVGFFCNALTGVILGMYVQYMFLNFAIGEIAGVSYDWRSHVGLTIVNSIVWIVLLILPFVVEQCLHNVKITRVYIPLFLFGIQFLGVCVGIIMAPKEAYHIKQYDFSGEEQFTVASKENVVLFILDAADNRFIKELLENGHYDFSAYQDFDLYTNTCSVFDATERSLPQMMTGSTFDEYPADYATAYRRMKDAGYRINWFGYESDEPQEMVSCVDNFKLLSTNAPVTIDYEGICRDSLQLTMYLVVPDLFKKRIATKNIDFYSKVFAKDELRYFYDNQEFYEHLDLTVNEQEEKYFIMEHIYGLHEPNDGFETTMIFCLDIVKKYMDQLQELGLYDDATIIVTADHGIHDDMGSFPYPTAATPVFLMKRAHQRQEQMRILETPIYHQDLLATLAYTMGVYEPDGQTLFGKTIFDFKEDERRERIFYNRDVTLHYYDRYTYTGNTTDLEKEYEKNNYVRVKEK